MLQIQWIIPAEKTLEPSIFMHEDKWVQSRKIHILQKVEKKVVECHTMGTHYLISGFT